MQQSLEEKCGKLEARLKVLEAENERLAQQNERLRQTNQQLRSEQIQAEQALRESEVRYRTLFQQANDAIFLSNEKDEIIDANQRACELLGYIHEELLTMKVPDLQAPEMRGKAGTVIKHELEHYGGTPFETVDVHHDGTRIPVEVCTSQVTGQEGGVVLSIVRNITERKRAEEVRRKNLARLTALVENLQMGVLVEDDGRRILHVNQAFCDLFGIEVPHLILGADCAAAGQMARWLFADPEEFLESIEARLMARETVLSEVLALADGRVFERDYVPIVTGEEHYGHLWLYRDVTARVQAEEALRKSEARYRRIVETAQEGIWELDAEAKTGFVNRQMAEMLGYPEGEMLGRSLFDFMDDAAAIEAERYFERRRRGIKERHDFRFRRKDGSELYAIVSTNPIFDEGGEFIGVLGTITDITERAQAEEALRESEERFRELADLLPQVVYETNAEGVLTYANHQAFDLFGYTRQDFEKGLNTLQMLVPEDRDRATDTIREILMGKRLGSGREYRALRKDGGTFPVVIYSSPIIRQGRTVGLRGLIIDITEQKRAEVALRESEAKYRTLVEQSLQGVVIAQDNPVRLRFANKPMQAILGFSPVELESMGPRQLVELIHPEDRQSFFRNFQDRLSGQKIAPRRDYRAIHQDGTVRWVETYSSRIEYDGSPATLTAFLDITERKQIELALQESEERYRTLVENVPIGIYRTTPGPQGRILTANPTFLSMFGLESRAELEQVTVADLYADPGERKVFSDNLLACSQVTGLEYHLKRRDGTSLWGSTTARVVYDKGKVVYFDCAIEDITERVQLEERQARLATAVEQTAESVVITDTAGDILYVNPAFERISGYRREEVMGQNPRLLKSGKQETLFYEELWATISAGRVWRGRFINKKRDGSLYTEEATISPVRDEQGVLINYVAVKRDVTRELQLEEQLLQSQKMEAVGQLAGGVAHDFNNLLTVINGFAELMQLKLRPDDPLWEMTAKIISSGRRAADLIRQLLAFSRQQVIQPQMLDLNTVVAEMERMLGRLIGEDIQRETVLSPKLWPVKVDPTQITQVIVNLAVNARDAMPTGGKLTIETANVVLDEEYAAGHLDAQPGEYVLLSVSDTGLGMSRTVQAHIFEPFFTTKEGGEGTGLGLATVYGIVKQSGGEIQVYSEEGQGTTFKIYLPRTEEAAQPRHRPESGSEITAGDETILLVEDDEEVRGLTRRVLHSLGYRVLEAGNGEEALPLAAGHTGPIHLLLTDVVLPGLGGKALAEQVAAVRPDLKVIYMSGYTDEAITRHGVLRPEVAFLQKPFNPEELARKVRTVLDG